jgi:hypothetical protein
MPVSVPNSTALATTAMHYGNASIYDFFELDSIVKQLLPELIFSTTTSQELPTWKFFVNKMQLISDLGQEDRKSTGLLYVVVAHLMIAFYFPFWALRGFGLNSWRLFLWRVEQRFLNRLK